jgi:Protein of unknown function (DUF2637)
MSSSSWWRLARGRGARWGVVILWVLGAVLSYSALRELALMLGFPEALADMWPLVVDVAVWVGSMNALEAGEQRRTMIARYAWVLVGLYAVATVIGNALVAGTEPVDTRLVRALGDEWAHAVSVIAHAAPAVTMVLFAHLAGLLMGEEPRRDGAVDEAPDAPPVAVPAAVPMTAPRPETVPSDGHNPGHVLPAWPALDGPASGHDVATALAVSRPSSGRPMTESPAAAMTAEQARQAAIRLVRRAQASGREVTAADVQRATGRSARQARRLLAAVTAETRRGAA